MFRINFERSVRIEGCPDSGVAAIDFRRNHGLPDLPDNDQKVEIRLTSERVARRAAELGMLDYAADLGTDWDAAPRQFSVRPYEEIPKTPVRGESCFDRIRVVLPPATVGALLDPPQTAGAGREDAVIAVLEAAASRRTLLLAEWHAARDAEIERRHVEKIEQEATARKLAEAHEVQERKLAEARELLAGVLANGETAQHSLAVVCDFLAAVPNDALRGTLRTLTADAGAEAMQLLQERIENASPVTIFTEDEETDDATGDDNE